MEFRASAVIRMLSSNVDPRFEPCRRSGLLLRGPAESDHGRDPANDYGHHHESQRPTRAGDAAGSTNEDAAKVRLGLRCRAGFGERAASAFRFPMSAPPKMTLAGECPGNSSGIGEFDSPSRRCEIEFFEHEGRAVGIMRPGKGGLAWIWEEGDWRDAPGPDCSLALDLLRSLSIRVLQTSRQVPHGRRPLPALRPFKTHAAVLTRFKSSHRPGRRLGAEAARTVECAAARKRPA